MGRVHRSCEGKRRTMVRENNRGAPATPFTMPGSFVTTATALSAIFQKSWIPILVSTNKSAGRDG